MDKNRLREKITILVPLIVGQTSEVGSLVSQHHYRWEMKVRNCSGSHRHCTVELGFEPRSALLQNMFYFLPYVSYFLLVIFYLILYSEDL